MAYAIRNLPRDKQSDELKDSLHCARSLKQLLFLLCAGVVAIGVKHTKHWTIQSICVSELVKTFRRSVCLPHICESNEF